MANKPMTEEEFLDRCRLIYRTGHARPAVLHCLDRAADALIRYVHFAATLHQVNAVPPAERGQDSYWRMEAARQQKDIFDSLVEQEVARVLKAGGNGPHQMTLANDAEGYAAVEFTAILTHPCQICATDAGAWWTRAGFCPHRRTGMETDKAFDKAFVE